MPIEYKLKISLRNIMMLLRYIYGVLKIINTEIFLADNISGNNLISRILQ